MVFKGGISLLYLAHGNWLINSMSIQGKLISKYSGCLITELVQGEENVLRLECGTTRSVFLIRCGYLFRGGMHTGSNGAYFDWKVKLCAFLNF